MDTNAMNAPEVLLQSKNIKHQLQNDEEN